MNNMVRKFSILVMFVIAAFFVFVVIVNFRAAPSAPRDVLTIDRCAPGQDCVHERRSHAPI